MKKGIILLLVSLFAVSAVYADGADVLRRKYSQVSIGRNTIKNDQWGKLKSDIALNYTNGRTFYLHEEEIIDMIRFGIDGTWTDLSYARYTRTLPLDGKFKEYKFNQFDYALNVGPSVHINPIDDVYVHAYFRYAPAYSLLFGDKQVYGNYATYFVTGLSVSYNFIALGFEGRFGNCNYNNYISAKRLDKLMPHPSNILTERVKHRGWRFYVSFMF